MNRRNETVDCTQPYYRLNPNRAIFLSGLINKDLVSKLTPEIIQLLHQSREPITVYIDSPGGSVAHAETILKLLKHPDQNLAAPCQIITAVTAQAASAAADFLASGDYATAYPTSSILYHGLRTYEEGHLHQRKPQRSQTSYEQAMISTRKNWPLKLSIDFV